MSEKLKLNDQSHPYCSANIFSRLLFTWISPLFKITRKRGLNFSDLWPVPSHEESEPLFTRLNKNWRRESRKDRPSLLRTILWTYRRELIISAINLFFQSLILVIRPVLIGWILYDLQDLNNPNLILNMCIHSIVLIVVNIFFVLIRNEYYWQTYLYGNRLRLAACALIYQKMSQMNQKSFCGSSSGHILTLLTSDMARLEQAFQYVHYFWMGLIQIFAILAIAIITNGNAAVLSILCILIFMIIQGFIGRYYGKMKLAVAEATDARLKILNDLIAGIRAIKMYCWEKFFLTLVEKARKRELLRMLFARLLQVFQITMSVYLPKIGMLLIYLSVLYLFPTDNLNALTSYHIFTCYGLLQSLYMNVTLFVPLSIQHNFDTHVACIRLQKFLLLPELEDDECSPIVKESSKPLINVHEASATWESFLRRKTLRDITINIEGNKLYGLVGSVGSGKSSLLQMILGELPVNRGLVFHSESIAYLPQTPWIFPGTIRENVLAGSELDAERYQKVLEVTALKSDCARFPAADATMVGERGISLSGGQKARIALARVAYSKAKIVLLDSPLVAVDAKISGLIFNKCIREFLSDRLRILITHKRALLDQMDGIIIMKEGTCGVYETFGRNMDYLAGDLNEIFGQVDEVFTTENKHNQTIDSTFNDAQDSGIGTTPNAHKFKALKLSAAKKQFQSDESLTDSLLMESLREEGENLEKRNQGQVSWKDYYTFGTMGYGPIGLILVIFLFILTILLHATCDIWVAKWATVSDYKYKASKLLSAPHRNKTELRSLASQLEHYSWFPNDQISVIILASLTAALTFVAILRTVCYFFNLIKASKKIHNDMLHSVIGTKLSFFEDNDSGRILNRFSKDTNQMDCQIQITFHDFFQSIMFVIQTCLIAVSTSYYVIIPMLPLILAFIYGRLYYLSVSRDLRRFDCLAKSCILKHTTVSLQGLPCLRTSKESLCRASKEFFELLNVHNSAKYLIFATQRWLAIRLDGLCVLFNTAVIVITLTLALCSEVPSGDLGLVLNLCASLVGMFQWCTRQSAEVENLMVSVERTLEYTKLEPESDELNKSDAEFPNVNEEEEDSDSNESAPLLSLNKPNKHRSKNTVKNDLWIPKSGLIDFQDVCLRYRPKSQLALNEINFIINPGKKVGIVGRTGAGKSSLITALFRLVELEHGKIEIDGTDLRSLSLNTLRSNISIIPQDPIMFTGNLRMNLDPNERYSDNELWFALKAVQLHDVINSNPLGLELSVAHEGSNFSTGERQLISLARAILQGNKILIIDEATANIDPVTDSVIQNTIRREFSDCTVLTIAHRLHTIMDSDLIMVMDHGEVVEYGQPYELLNPVVGSNSNVLVTGALARLVEQTGTTECQILYDIALKAFNHTKNSLSKQ